MDEVFLKCLVIVLMGLKIIKKKTIQLQTQLRERLFENIARAPVLFIFKRASPQLIIKRFLQWIFNY